MKKAFFLLIFFPLIIMSQDLTYEEENFVTGIVLTDKGVFLLLQDGFLELEKTDKFEEYYRKIYNDSTIVNPNTILENTYNINLIPVITQTINPNNSIKLDVPRKLDFFLQHISNKEYKLTSTAKEIIKQLSKK